MKNLVAVYGSLRKGEGNHGFMDGSKYLGSEFVEGWDMYSYGSFPFIARGEGRVLVEVYEVDDENFKHIDGLEGYPTFYNRQKIDTQFGKAWVYFIENEVTDKYPEVYNGDWVEYLEAQADY